MKKNTAQKIAAVALPSALFLASFTPAFALDVTVDTGANATVPATGTGVGVGAKGRTGYDVKPLKGTITAERAAKISTAQANANARAAKQIEVRTNDLIALQKRIGAMKNVSDGAKTALTASLSTNIDSLAALKTKIESDTTAADLKADTAQITKGERIYALIKPQVNVTAAADRIGVVAGMLTDMNAKIQVRVTAAQTAGKDVSAITALQADMTAKIVEAKAQAAAATALVVGLVPDNGDKTILASNNAALKNARADLEAATKALKAAQKDMDGIVKMLKAPKASVDIKKDLSTQ